jgi:hypothetical protein
MSEDYSNIPDAAVPEGWELRGRSEDRLFDAGAASVIGRTLLYTDAEIERALEAAGVGKLLAPAQANGAAGPSEDRLVDIDTVAPFAFATALSFHPPLAPGIGPATVFPMIITEARRSFATDFRARGFESVDRDRHQKIRTETGDRARLTKYTAVYPLGQATSAETLRVEGWLAVWTHNDAFRVAGGAYPTSGLSDLLEDQASPPETDPSKLRSDLLDLIRAVR